MQVGRVAQLFRYPVKSMGGEAIASAALGRQGIPGDRAFAVRDERRGGIRGAKKIPALMRCRARYLEEPKPGQPAPAPEIALPPETSEGVARRATIRADAPDASARLSEALGTEVTLWPLLPPTALDHYRRGPPDHADVEQELRAIFGREPDEPLPNLAVLPPVIFEYESPPGTYFDAAPLLLLTDASLRRLQALAPASRVDVRRFRPNLVVETWEEGFPEVAWAGRRIRVGGAVLRATIPCPRCVMITHGFDDLPRDTGLMRTVVREADQCLGIYAEVETPGPVRVGDPVALEG